MLLKKILNKSYNEIIDMINKIKSEHPLTQGAIEQLE